MADKVVVPVVFTGDGKDLVQASKSSQTSLKDLQKELNKTQKSAKETTSGIKNFSTEISKSQLPMAGMAGGMLALAKSPAALVVGLGAATVASAVFFKGIGNGIDKMSKFSKVSDTNIESLSRYRLVADLMGANFEKLQRAILRGSVSIGDGSKEVTDALDDLGLSIEDLEGQRGDVIFETIGAALSRMESPTKRANAAMKIFGKGGAEVLAAFQGGPALFNDITKQADELGFTISEKGAAAVEEFNDHWTVLTSSFSTAGEEVAIFLAGHGNSLFDWISDISENLSIGVSAWDSFWQATTRGESQLDEFERKTQEYIDGLQKAIDQAEKYTNRTDKQNEAIKKLKDQVTSHKKVLEEFQKVQKRGEFSIEARTKKLDEERAARQKVTLATRNQTAAQQDQNIKLDDFDSKLGGLYDGTVDFADAQDEVTAAVENLENELRASREVIDDYDASTFKATETTTAFAASMAQLQGVSFRGFGISGGITNAALNAFNPQTGDFNTAGFIGSAGNYAAGVAQAQGGPLSQLLGAGAGLGGGYLGYTLGSAGSLGGPGGAALGFGIGNLIGSLSGGLFGGGGEQPAVSFQTAPLGSFDVRRGRFGQRSVVGTSDISQTLIGGRDGGGIEPWMQQSVDALVAIENRLASTLSPDQLTRAQTAASIDNETRAENFNLDENIRIHFQNIFTAIGGELGDAFDILAEDAGITAEELTQVADTLSRLNELSADGELNEHLPQALDTLVVKLQEMAIEGESVAETYDRVNAQTHVFENSLKLLGQQFEGSVVDVSDAIVQLLGGVAEFTAKTSFFFEQFFSPEEQAANQLAIAAEEVADFTVAMADLGFEVDTSREGFRDFVVGLDLSNEAQREAYAAALEAAPSIDALADAAESTAASIAAWDKEIKEGTETFESLTGTLNKVDSELDGVADAASDLSNTVNDIVAERLNPTKFIPSITQPIDPNKAGADFAKIIGRGLGDLFGSSLELKLALELDQVLEALSHHSVGPVRDLLISERDRIKGDQAAIARLNTQFGGLGAERFELMREFSPLFDGTDLSDLERDLGFDLFRERWADIVENAKNAILDPITGLGEDIRAGDIAGYLNSLLLGDLSSLTPSEQLGLAKTNFKDLVARVKAGEFVSATDLTEAHQAYAGELRSHFGVGPQFTAAFNQATDQLAAVGQTLADTNQQEVQFDQLTELRKLVGLMGDVKTAIGGGVTQIGGGL